MKLLKGREVLGKYKGVEVEINWDYVAREHGFRKEQEKFESALGRYILTFSLFYLFILTLLELASGRVLWLNFFSIRGLPEVAAWVGVFLILYAFYLGRNRDSFLDHPNFSNLYDLHTKIEKRQEPVSRIDLTTYIDHDLLNLLDDLINGDTERFLDVLMSELWNLPSVAPITSRIGLDSTKLKEIMAKFNISGNGNIDLWIKHMMFESGTEALELHMQRIDERAVSVYLLKHPLKEILEEYNISDKEVSALGLWLKNSEDISRYRKLFNSRRALKPTSTVNRAFTSRFSPTLVQFSRDFTAEVVGGDFTFSIAREAELEELIKMTEAGESSAALIVGEPGIGKTTLLKSLAVRMVVEEVPDVLKDKRLVGFDFIRAFALANNIEVFKGRLEKVFEEVAAARNIVLVIDDFDQVVAIREDFAGEVISIIVNAASKYKLRIIATSSPEGYSEKIKPQRALAAMFNTLELKEPADEIAVQVLMDILPRLESKYGIKVSFDASVKLVKLSHKFNFDKVLPDKAIDLLDEIMVRSKSDGLDYVAGTLIEQVVSQKVGVKVGAIGKQESEVLINMEKELHKRLVGQEDAVKAVAAALRRSRAGLVSEKRPIASFLFFGPTGVGKTELAKALAEVYYGDSKLMTRLDMSEYQEAENLERLIGTEQGDRFEGGFLSEAIRSRPFSLVLLDEIEKANPKVLYFFLQVLDEGSLTDGMGRKVDFTNTIIIATSNAGSKQIADMLSGGKSYAQVNEAVLPKLREVLRVEFLNRFDKVIMFRPLMPIEVEQVAGLMMNNEKRTLADKGIELNYKPLLLQQLAKEGYNPIYGARELRRIIQERVEDHLAKLIVAGKVKSGSVIEIESLDKFVIVE